MNDELVQRIRNCPTLPSLPAIAVQVLNIAQSPEADIAEMARLITTDPALSSKILKTVNSSFYGRPQHVSTISQALVILGLQSVKTLVLGFSLVTNLKTDKAKNKGFDHMRYWKRSVYAATAARVLSARARVVQHEEAFLATLLADIGMLVFDQVLGEDYGKLCASAARHGDLAGLEQAQLGMTHADVGRIMTESWKLPPVLAVPVAMHHTPDEVTEPSLKKLSQLVGLAGLCADVFVDEQPAGAIHDVRTRAGILGINSATDCDSMLAEIGTKTREIASLFEINIGSQVQFEQILKRANEALIEITLHTQQQASSLAEQNQQLKQVAYTDALTGLSNRQHFDRFLDEQVNLSLTSGAPVSLIMIDLDHFKKVNDTHGHPAGDAVLKFVAKLLRTSARAQDVACRYGGEEMALIMPGTTRSTAAATAETIRRAICAKPVPTDDIALNISGSLGVATLDPSSPFKSASQLLKAADLALYNAKNSGRNCVKVFTMKSPQPQAA